MRVLFVHDRPSGGAGESLYRLCLQPEIDASIVFAQKGFLKHKFDELQDSIDVRYTSTRSWIQYRRFSTSLLSHLRLLLAAPGHYAFFSAVRDAARQLQPDLIYSNTMYLCEGALAAKAMGIPHIWQVRELYDLDYYQYGIPKTSLTRWLSRLSRFVVCNSERTLASVHKFFPRIPNARVIHNIVDPPEQSLDLRDRLGLDESTTLVGIVGWITPNKRVEDFVSVAGQFHSPNVKFLIIGGWGGNSDYNERIRRAVESNPNRDNIMLTGVIDDLHGYIGSLNVLLCPCYTESFGRTVGEALAAGVPAIGIRGSATQELIEHERSGFLVSKGDVATIADCTHTLIEDRSLAREYCQAGQANMSERFSTSVQMPRFMELFKEAVGPVQGPRQPILASTDVIREP